MADWMKEGRDILGGNMGNEEKEEANKAGTESLGFNFAGKKGREGREFTMKAVHNYKCKWDACNGAEKATWIMLIASCYVRIRSRT